MRPFLKTFAFLALTLTLLPLQCVARSPELARFYHMCLVRIVGLKITRKGTPQKMMLISNHTSWLDIVVLGSVMPLSFIAKSEVRGWFLFGLLARLQNTIFVTRNDPRKSLETITEIKATTCPLVLFAEGTTSDGTRILPLNATLTQSPAQPVMINYADKSTAWIGEMTLLPHIWAMFKKRKIEVTIHFHTPLEGERKTITREAEAQIRQSHEKYQI
jgi:lyso-ornithine lipid O-acyltransferase